MQPKQRTDSALPEGWDVVRKDNGTAFCLEGPWCNTRAEAIATFPRTEPPLPLEPELHPAIKDVLDAATALVVAWDPDDSPEEMRLHNAVHHLWVEMDIQAEEDDEAQRRGETHQNDQAATGVSADAASETEVVSAPGVVAMKPEDYLTHLAEQRRERALVCPHGEEPWYCDGCQYEKEKTNASELIALRKVAEAARELTSWDWGHLLIDYGTDAGDVVECVDKLAAALKGVPSSSAAKGEP